MGPDGDANGAESVASSSVETLFRDFSAVRYDPSIGHEDEEMRKELENRANIFLGQIVPKDIEYSIGANGLLTVVDGTVRIYVHFEFEEGVNAEEIVTNLKHKVPNANVYFQVSFSGLFAIPIAEFDRMTTG